MNVSRFDTLTRSLVTTASSRRGLLRGMAGIAFGTLATALGAAEAGATLVNCVQVGRRCKRSGQCCSGRCRGPRTKRRAGRTTLVPVLPRRTSAPPLQISAGEARRLHPDHRWRQLLLQGRDIDYTREGCRVRSGARHSRGRLRRVRWLQLPPRRQPLRAALPGVRHRSRRSRGIGDWGETVELHAAPGPTLRLLRDVEVLTP